MFVLLQELLKRFYENLKKQFADTCKFPNHESINLFCFCRKVFTHYMIRKRAMKHHYVIKMTFTLT